MDGWVRGCMQGLFVFRQTQEYTHKHTDTHTPFPASLIKNKSRCEWQVTDSEGGEGRGWGVQTGRLYTRYWQ